MIERRILRRTCAELENENFLAKRDMLEELKLQIVPSGQVTILEVVPFAKSPLKNCICKPQIPRTYSHFGEKQPPRSNVTSDRAGLPAAAAAARLVSPPPDIIAAIAALYAESGDQSNIGFFESKLGDIDGYPALDFYGAYTGLLIEADEATQVAGLDKIKMRASEKGQSPWRRISAFKAMAGMMSQLSQLSAADATNTSLSKRVMEMGTTMKTIRDAEPEGQLKQIFQQMFPGE
jgi:hypothetical protein